MPDKAEKPPSPSPTVIIHVVCESSRSSSDILPGQVWGEKREKELSELGFVWLSKSPSPTVTNLAQRILIRGRVGCPSRSQERDAGYQAPRGLPGSTQTAPDDQRVKVWERSRSILTSKEDKNGS